MSISSVCSEIKWLHGLFDDLGCPISTPTPLYGENTTAIRIASNPVFHERTKSIEVHCHFIQDYFLEGRISVPYIASQQQVADIFTKSYTRSRHNYLVNKLMPFDLP